MYYHKNKINSAILGLGNIGLMYDLNKPDYIMTHAKALHKIKEYNLICGIDPLKKSRNLFEKKFKLPTYKNLKELTINKKNIDLIVISTPTFLHYKNFLYIIKNFNPKIIVCEKPLSYKVSEIYKIINICEKKKIFLITNFVRRSDPTYINLKKKFNRMKDITGTFYYDKEFNHSCSHYLNLCNFWFGKIKSFKILKVHKKNEYDANIDIVIKFEKAKINFINTKKKTRDEFFINFDNNIIEKNKDEPPKLNDRKLSFTLKKYQKNFYLKLYNDYHLKKKKTNFDEIKYQAKTIDKIIKKAQNKLPKVKKN